MKREFCTIAVCASLALGASEPGRVQPERVTGSPAPREECAWCDPGDWSYNPAWHIYYWSSVRFSDECDWESSYPCSDCPPGEPDCAWSQFDFSDGELSPGPCQYCGTTNPGGGEVALMEVLDEATDAVVREDVDGLKRLLAVPNTPLSINRARRALQGTGCTNAVALHIQLPQRLLEALIAAVH